jgi:hypothetical protein
MDARTETALTLTNRAALELLEDYDTRLIKLWLHGRPTNTAKAYRGDVDRFRVFVKGRPLRECRLQDLQAFADSLEGLAEPVAECEQGTHGRENPRPARNGQALERVRKSLEVLESAFPQRAPLHEHAEAVHVPTVGFRRIRRPAVEPQLDKPRVVVLEQLERRAVCESQSGFGPGVHRLPFRLMAINSTYAS